MVTQHADGRILHKCGHKPVKQYFSRLECAAWWVEAIRTTDCRECRRMKAQIVSVGGPDRRLGG